MDFNIELLKIPTEEDWALCKTCALNTVGKKSVNMPDMDWKKQMLASEHSPIRVLNFCIKMEVPYYASVHLARHKFGVEHFVQSQRNDRQQNYDRKKAPQDAMVSHIMWVNAQELMFVARRRLCSQADETTQAIIQKLCDMVEEACPEFAGCFEPMCSYRGGRCTEFFCCGRNKAYKNKF